METLKKIGKFIFYTAAIYIIIYTVIYRTSVWINEPGFFGDEGALIYNIQTRNFFQLFLPLDQAQCCPPLFLCFAKIVYMIFGLNETALRFFPYITGVATGILSFFVGNKIFKFKSSSIILVIQIMLSNCLVFYSQEFKQYSSDAFFSLLIFYLFLVLKDKIDTNKKALLFGIGLGLSGFISLPAEFVVAPVCFYYLFHYLKQKQYKRLLCMSLPYITLSVALFFLMISDTLQGSMLDLPMWAEGCDTFKSLETVKSLFLYIKGEINLITFSTMFFVGIIYMAVKERFLLYLLATPILMNIISGYCHLYPFTESRVICWLFPFVFIITLKSFDFLKTKNNISNILVEILIFAFAIFLFLTFEQSKQCIISQEIPYYFYRSNAREYVKKLEKMTVKPTDTIFIDVQGEGIFNIYDKEHKYFGKNVLCQQYEKPFNFISHTNIKVIENLKRNSDKAKDAKLNDLPIGTTIYFYIDKINWEELKNDALKQWIEDNTKILFRDDDVFGEFYYVEKIK